MKLTAVLYDWLKGDPTGSINDRRILRTPGFRKYILRRTLCSLQKTSAQRTKRVNGKDLTFDLADYDQRFFYYGIQLEPENIGLLEQIAKQIPNGVFFDVGANYGHFSYRLTEHFSASHLFEPNPRAARFLRLLHEGRRSVTIHQLALSNTNSSAHLAIPDKHSGGARLDSHGISTTTLTIDSFVRETGAAPDVIKLDVEDFEHIVLEGASDTLLKHQPIVAFEIHDQEHFRACKRLLPESMFFAFRHRMKYGLSGVRKITSAAKAVVLGPDLRLSFFEEDPTGYISLVFCVPPSRSRAFQDALVDLSLAGVTF